MGEAKRRDLGKSKRAAAKQERASYNRDMVKLIKDIAAGPNEAVFNNGDDMLNWLNDGNG